MRTRGWDAKTEKEGPFETCDQKCEASAQLLNPRPEPEDLDKGETISSCSFQIKS